MARYSQFLMAQKDMEKTSFITEWGTYCYRVMSFDDMIVKSRNIVDHLAALERFFERIRLFRLRLNPKKCTFGVTSRKLLGCMCQCAFKRKEYFLSPLVLMPPTPGRLLLLYLSVSDIALGCMSALIDRLMRWLVLLTEFDIHYVTQKSIKKSIVADHLTSLPVSDGRAIDDDFLDEDFATVTSLSGWRMYFDGMVNHSGYGIETTIELGIRQMKNQFVDALTTLASMIDIPTNTVVRSLLIESRSVPAYCCLIDEAELDDGLPWYHDIYQFLRLGVYPEVATTKDKR
ncbi:hypothetical protein CK203_081239 [Vitis vinifera]|uniref:Reverse transcriptase domain-containing protein n=1 Tax=Vitis vinifera TaxID=29760 RepID=A0A438DAP9_VITVI|nr:hypothetical protein CK203_081239 [Vitis vinifera]